ncbi:hypothetical protein MNEG_9491 [Monoraphidium neglectum]|uniref:DNA2/NAM7 helicase helicase domain-containing protein n=1 Tax=Monoraphidium neglectum TaxID=145388 RepID=A0A0D2JGB4_9CHLO|nr:hypothetical protein MNEG_9491 [Monoraphidium neglectum]KIY98472.1 hypothetical protein MNEG_9491 [Monoraphidium neglectum]|eukprot:XP_013897492.1 hypothetical protein MNEG_9491 [Monoraphidium neglectum]
MSPSYSPQAGDNVLIRRQPADGGTTPQQRRGRASPGASFGSGGSSYADEDEDEGEGAEDSDYGEGEGRGGGGGAAARGRAPISATLQAVHKKYLLVAMDKEDSDTMQAEVAGSPALAPPADWRVDQAENDVAAKRQLEAIERLGSLQDKEHAAFEQLARCCTVGSPRSADVARVPPLWVRDKGWRAAAKAQLAAQHGLNRSQRKAVADAMIASVTLWQGPPGTGKTATLLALIQVLVGACKGAFSSAPASKAAAVAAAGEESHTAAREMARKRWKQMGPVLAW